MTETGENKEVIYEFGKFRLNARERILTSDGSPMRLPAKEFDTLLLLVENNRRVLSKEEMMVSIWQDVFVEESNLAKQISRLRKVLTTNGTNYIETVPKHGYRFSADLRIEQPVVEQPVIVEKRTIKRLTVAVENDVGEPARRTISRRTAPIIAVVTGVFLSILMGMALWLSNPLGSTGPTEISSIAVLPLRSLTNEESSKALGLGLTDALIAKIGSLKQVVVRPTGAVSRFTNEQADAAEIGKKLRVDAVLEGTIQQADGRLRVNARLIRTDTGEQLWAERFDEPLAGIFALQDALSAKIAKTLALELTNSQNSHQGTANAEAYEMFLRGRFYQSENTPDGLNRSIELYEQAIALDPSFAQAHAGIADAKIILYNFNFAPEAATIPQARQSISRALQLDPELSNAHTSLALIQFLVERNWPEAEKSLQRAIEINPSNADAYNRYGYFLMRMGSFDEALEKYAKARELNPLSNIVQSGIGLTYLCAGRYPEAIDQLEKTSAENPQFAHSRWLLGTAYEASGNPERSFEENLKALEIEGGSDFAAVLRKEKDVRGIDAANRLWLDESVKRQSASAIAPLFIAMRAATVKDSEATLFWLEKSQGETTLGGIRYLSKFDFVRDNARFKSIIRELPY